MPFTLTLQPPRALLTVSGELDISHRRDLLDAIDQAIDLGRCPQVFLDLARVTFIDSSTVHLFLGLVRRLEDVDGALVVVDASPAVLRVVGILRATHQLGLGFGDDEPAFARWDA